MRYEISMTALLPLATKPGSLTDIVFESLRNAIVDKRLAPGQRLNESKLATQLRVSKTPVREALLRLESIGLVIAHATQGLQVIERSREAIQYAYEVRSGLEAFAASLAATRATSQQRDAIVDAATGSLTCADPDDSWRRLSDRTFHSLISAAAGNPRLSVLIDNHYALTWALRERDVRSAAETLECARQHVRVADAIKAGDGSAAATAMATHLSTLCDLVLEAADSGT